MKTNDWEKARKGVSTELQRGLTGRSFEFVN